MPDLTAQSGAVANAAGSVLGGNLQQRLSALKVQDARSHNEVRSETEKLTKTYPPSHFAFGAILLTGITFDALNYLFIWLNVAPGLGALFDAIMSFTFFFCVRALMNRPISTQRTLGLMIIAALVFIVFLGPVGGVFVGYALLLPVFYLGIRNPGVQVAVVDKEKIQQSIQRFEKTVEKAQAVVARLGSLGRKTKGLQQIASRAAGAGKMKAVSGSSKIMRRLLGTRIAELVPILSLLPFNIISTFMTYSALKKDHAEAKQLLAEYQQRQSGAQSLEAATLREQYQAQMAGVITDLMQPEEEPVTASATAGRVVDVRKPTPAAPTTAAREPRLQRGTMRDVRSTTVSAPA